MWSLGDGDTKLRDEIQQFRRDANNEIQQISYHIASLNSIQFNEKIQQNFLISIQKYSEKSGASPYYLHHLLTQYNLHFIAVLFSMLNTTKTQEFQHRFCMLAQFLCTGCWTFADQLAFLKLINILLTHSDHLYSLTSSNNHERKIDDEHLDNVFLPIQNQKLMIYHNFIQWIQNLCTPEQCKIPQQHDKNNYHRHHYPDLNRERIFEFMNLLILHRPDMLFKLISYLNTARQINNETGIIYIRIF